MFKKLLILQLFYLSTVSGKLEHVQSDGILYAGNAQLSSFSNDMELWSNFTRLLEKRNITKITQICASGPWLVYKRNEYQVYDIKNLHMFVGGKNGCFQPKNISDVGSMQPISPMIVKSSSIALFQEPLFASFSFTLAPAGEMVSRLKKSWLPDLRSIITYGPQSYSLLGEKEKKNVCIKPKSSGKTSLCFLHDVNSEKFFRNRRFTGIIANCSKNDSIVELSLCKEGGPKLENIPEPKAKEQPKTPKKKKEPLVEQDSFEPPPPIVINCNESHDILDNQTLNEEMIHMLAFLRYSHDFSSPVQIMWPDRQEDLWKTNILDTIFQIAIATIPDVIVPSMYLKIVREFTIFHLDKVWKSSKNGSFYLNQDDIEHALDAATSCYSSVQLNTQILRELLLETFDAMVNPKQLNFLSHPILGRDINLDHVIDSAWMVTNYAYAICQHLSTEVEPFWSMMWSNFNRIVRGMYFTPLSPTWKKPEISSRSYTLIFGGFGIKSVHKRLAYATSIALLQPRIKYHLLVRDIWLEQ